MKGGLASLEERLNLSPPWGEGEAQPYLEGLAVRLRDDPTPQTVVQALGVAAWALRQKEKQHLIGLASRISAGSRNGD